MINYKMLISFILLLFVVLTVAYLGVLCPQVITPNRCELSGNFVCKDYAVSHGQTSSSINLEISSNVATNNLHLNIEGCKLESNEQAQNTIRATFDCAPNENSFDLGNTLNLLINPCWEGRVSFQKDIYVFEGNEIMSKGRLLTHENGIPLFLPKINIKVKFIKIIRKIIPLTLIGLMIIAIITLTRNKNNIKSRTKN